MKYKFDLVKVHGICPLRGVHLRPRKLQRKIERRVTKQKRILQPERSKNSY